MERTGEGSELVLPSKNGSTLPPPSSMIAPISVATPSTTSVVSSTNLCSGAGRDCFGVDKGILRDSTRRTRVRIRWGGF